jgi:hypothetical protein
VTGLTENDVLVTFNLWRYLEATRNLFCTAKERGAKTLLITGSRVSPLVREADALLLVAADAPELSHSNRGAGHALERADHRCRALRAGAHARQSQEPRRVLRPLRSRGRLTDGTRARSSQSPRVRDSRGARVASGRAPIHRRGTGVTRAPMLTGLRVSDAGSASLSVPQLALLSFTVLFLHDAKGLSTARAALVLAAIQGGTVALRLLAGHYSDRRGERLRPLGHLALDTAVALVVLAASTGASTGVDAALLIAAGVLAVGWNGVSFTATAELAPAAHRGAAFGFQQTALNAAGTAAPILVAAVVSATSWRSGFLVLAAFAALAFAILGRLTPATRCDAVAERLS